MVRIGIALPVIAVQVLAATPGQMSVLSALDGVAVLLSTLFSGVPGVMLAGTWLLLSPVRKVRTEEAS
jgi:hypothetical protein